MRVVLTEQESKTGGEPTLSDVREALIVCTGLTTASTLRLRSPDSPT